MGTKWEYCYLWCFNRGLADGLETFSVETAGGVQPSMCIRKRELAWWLASLESQTVRRLEQRFGIPLGDFKQSIMDAADALWWGVRAIVPTPAASGRIEVTIRLECLRCRTRHKYTSDRLQSTWSIDDQI